MTKWRKDSDGNYFLTTESNPDWFATVFQYDGRWTFRIGTRVKEGEEQRTFKSRDSWKSVVTAKRKAIYAITWADLEL